MKSFFINILLIAGIFFHGSAQNIIDAEYFFDTDPGLGNGTALALSPGDTVSQQYSISPTGLPVGPHIFCMRTKNTGGNWSHQLSRTFYVHSTVNPIQPL